MFINATIYAVLHGIRLHDVPRHRAVRLASLLSEAGCSIHLTPSGMGACMPGRTRPLGLRAALNRVRKAGMLRGLRAGAVLPAIEVEHVRRGNLIRETVTWCVCCQKLHRHGGGFGHRVAHCIDKNGLYSEFGYTLVAVASQTAEAAE